MENSASVNYIKVPASDHFKFNCSAMKDLKIEQFVSSPVFHALGNEWVIECYPLGLHRDLSGNYTFFHVRLHIEHKTMNPIISLSLMKRDGKADTLLIGYTKSKGEDILCSAPQQSPFQGQLFACSFISNSELKKDFIKDGCFELICRIDNKDIPNNRCSLGVPKSSDLHSQIGKLSEGSKTADVIFHVENRSFMGHRLILAARFKAELFRNMAEAKEKCIKIEDMSPEVFEAMLHFIYTDYFPYFDSEKSSTIMTQHLFVAADRYAIDGLKVLCEDQLCAHISLDTVTATLALALQSQEL